jgi:hypothetical protein
MEPTRKPLLFFVGFWHFGRSPMKNGTVLRLCGESPDRYGFIKEAGCDSTYFFLARQTKAKAPLVEGARVRFEVEPAPDKPDMVGNGRAPKARNVEVIREV